MLDITQRPPVVTAHVNKIIGLTSKEEVDFITYLKSILRDH